MMSEEDNEIVKNCLLLEKFNKFLFLPKNSSSEEKQQFVELARPLSFGVYVDFTLGDVIVLSRVIEVIVIII